jgi:transposase InsO family protein
VLPIAPSTYYMYAARRADPALLSVRAKRDAALGEEIWRVLKENFEVYGTAKVWGQLPRGGIQVARCTVERLMKKLGLQGVRRGKKMRTTVSDPAAPRPRDRVTGSFRPIDPTRCGCRISRMVSPASVARLYGGEVA